MMQVTNNSNIANHVWEVGHVQKEPYSRSVANINDEYKKLTLCQNESLACLSPLYSICVLLQVQ